MFSSQFSSAARIPQRLNSPAAPSTKQGKIWEEKQTSFVFVNSLKRDNRREYIRLWVHLFELVASSRGHCMSSNRCVPVFLSGNDAHRCWLCSSSQHIAPSGHRSLASVDGKGQVWLADASLHTSTDFGSPPPQAPVNQELMKGYLRHMRHLARVSTRTSLFIPLLWKFIFLFSLCCQFEFKRWFAQENYSAFKTIMHTRGNFSCLLLSVRFKWWKPLCQWTVATVWLFAVMLHLLTGPNEFHLTPFDPGAPAGELYNLKQHKCIIDYVWCWR